MGGALYPGPVNFTCVATSLPSEATCIFTPTSVGQAAGPAMVNLTITTTAPSVAPPLARRGPWNKPMGLLLWVLAALLSFGLLAVPRAARRLRHALTVLLLVVLSGLAVSCGGGGGGGGGNPGTPLGTFTVTVQVQSGNMMHPVPFTLTVKP